uniref:Uncharacterized protein n=1 Tax=uncultured marine bacterium HF4000_APKG2098 TaxID=455614 RepID=B3TCN9_9BACT|nr:hypothetical protein ALOHA_HF4000APKG2098ctg6 [uncultured marine bacterium HF4000_APKG2098]
MCSITLGGTCARGRRGSPPSKYGLQNERAGSRGRRVSGARPKRPKSPSHGSVPTIHRPLFHRQSARQEETLQITLQNPPAE